MPNSLDMTRKILITLATISFVLIVMASSDLAQAASKLFDALHRADASDGRAIAVAPIPQQGIGAAINDRLARAAAR